jgi:hypothetical protein
MFIARPSLKFVFVGTLALVTGTGSLAHATEVPLRQDAYVSAKKATKNFGSKPTLLLTATETVFAEFDVSTLPAGTSASAIQKANLWIWLGDVKAPGTFSIRRVTQPWTEESISGMLAPLTVALDPFESFAVGSDEAKGWRVLDVTAFVQGWVTNAFPNHGLALVANAGAAVVLDSKENEKTGRMARLDVTLAATSTGAMIGCQMVGGEDPIGFQASPVFVSKTATVTVAANEKLIVDAMGAFVSDKAGGEKAIVILGYRKVGTFNPLLSGIGEVVAIPTYSETNFLDATVSLHSLLSGLEAGTYEIGIVGYGSADSQPPLQSYSTRYSVRVQRFK